MENVLPSLHLCRYLEESAARFPERLAAIDPDGSSLTYRELNLRASRIAGFLADRGVKPGDRVGLVLPKSTAALAALFGVMKIRAAYVPVDWTGPFERVRTILTDCRVCAVFLDRRRADLVEIAEAVVLLGPETAEGARCSASGPYAWETVLEHEPGEPDMAARQPDDLAYILYTSGSTGIPKGVMLTHRNATSYVDWCSEVFVPTEEDRFSSHAPFHFDLSILDIYVPIKHGGSVHLIPDELGKHPKDLARFVASRQLTVWYSTPAILGLLAEFGDLDRLDCSRLRLVLFAGEVFPVKQLRRIVARWPAPAYYNLYGPTETNVCTFALIPKPIPEDRTEPYPIGWPCSHCASLVLDSEGQPVNPGEEGLLYIAGPSVFSGYWGRENESAAVFLERDGTRWYNTGDVVKEDAADGFIYMGRRDRMVKRRGYRIELGEVESCLYRHPSITEAAAIPAPDPQSGMRIVAYLVSPPDAQPSIVEMKGFCNQHLPAYMNPDIFVFAGALPRTSTNKVDYQALIRKFQAAEQGSGAKSAPAR
jgi:amino acid adenylation domain-containing protein